MIVRMNRRALLASPLTFTAAERAMRMRRRVPASAPMPQVTVSVALDDERVRPFEREAFGIVGVFDVDWLDTPGFTVLLDNLAASPGAFRGVRVFGAFTAGVRERFLPESGGDVWTAPEAPIDFSTTFRALEALTSRGLVPFVVFGMFPPAISSSPTRPPGEWERWKTLVCTFLRELAADPRFGADAIARWWFEAWNEPNEGRFWRGTEDEFRALYRATSEAVAESGLIIRLGGPAIAWKPQENPDFGAPWMERFLRFVASDPALRLDFVSLHCKGTVDASPPDPRRLHDAALTTATLMRAIAPERFSGLAVINDEADEKVGFEVPYGPRLREDNAAWLAATLAIHAGLVAEPDIRFVSAADNANLQLVEAPFDGRRSIMTRATDSETDLLKIPAYGFYELLRLLGDARVEIGAGAHNVFPATDLYHLATVAETHVACLLAWYPDPDRDDAGERSLAYIVRDIPWSRVNVARFQIDRRHSNAWTAAGGSEANPFPVPNRAWLGTIRRAQEVALVRPIARDVALDDRAWREELELAPYTTTLLWITPVLGTEPVAPTTVVAEMRDGTVELRWTPCRQPDFFSYEVVLIADDGAGERLSPVPLRSALWVETAPPPGPRTYGVRVVTASGVASELVIASPVAGDGWKAIGTRSSRG
jgi:hypothetical protein